MKISLISVGKIKEKYLKDAISEYTKRLSAYCSLVFIEVADEKAPETLSNKEAIQIKEKEGEKILSKIKEGQYVFALDLSGKQRTSEAFAKELDQLQIYGNSDLVFVIGGSLGLSQEVINRSNTQISFSKMTFPHQLMKVILLEQIYRGYKIIRNEPYHK
ncbi:23S rRNA (pseudouridine1915-N3)-methyltransferase [Petrocella atlantisensis]|uniref:Ribosomal RNA large subunit methyltransferase H n=1 Tax=Petrocella atlantisensis TaxID=2173034 RepID=A0A3P7PXG4_9FIRM|nr:23S rRNA (pseudouridine(1915)-N(3))-methyltransferase RlmH [Petrocella atlantisensis]VDN47891.1 23S rRNA (pseudouridine1915-N3)-methyltransferase [Petrocella atlantisensis]